MKYIKLFENYKELKTFLKKYDNFEEDYGYYKITTKNAEKEKEKILKKFESEISKIDVDKNHLTIYKNNAKYDCVMLYSNINKNVWQKLLDKIDKKDIYDPEEYGLEKEPHLTIIYGIHSTENDKDEIIEKLKEYKSLKLKVKGIGFFENDKYDVVKLDIEPSKELLSYRKDLIAETKNTQTFPGYHPHMTLSYVKKGKGKKYVEKYNKEFEFDTIIYSDHNYKKNKIKLQD